MRPTEVRPPAGRGLGGIGDRRIRDRRAADRRVPPGTERSGSTRSPTPPSQSRPASERAGAGRARLSVVGRAPACSTRASIERALDAAAGELGVTRSTLLEPFVPRRPSRGGSWRGREASVGDGHGAEPRMATSDVEGAYVEHPVTGPLGRTLVWTIDDGVHRSTGIPSAAARAVSFRQTDDVVVTPPAEAVIRPWHPLLADDIEVRSWAIHLDRHRLEQAIEQVHRPVFRITGDEPATHETHRFSERVVDLPTAEEPSWAGWAGRWGGLDPSGHGRRARGSRPTARGGGRSGPRRCRALLGAVRRGRASGVFRGSPRRCSGDRSRPSGNEQHLARRSVGPRAARWASAVSASG